VTLGRVADSIVPWVLLVHRQSGRIIMSELTLESLARRLEEVERRLNEKQAPVIAPSKDWRSVVGISEMTEFSRLMQAEMDALRDADRRAAEMEDCE
jgi:hypothetical protein